MDALHFFESFLYEAPGDDPPDVGPPDVGGDAPPDMPDTVGSDPPEMGGEEPPDMGGDAPPDMGDDSGDFASDMDDGEFGDPGGEGSAEQDPNESMGLDDKVSAIMNMQLYQRFQSLLNNIGSELTMCKINTDILYTLSPEAMEIVPSLKKLDENVRLYLKNSFVHENYSRNLLFFNKCLNLLKLLNDSFDSHVHKGIRELE